MRKVSWPSRKELITYTIVVIITMIVVALFTSVVDVLISGFLNLLARLRG
ncbi:MAG TPA: preprotein translocase subunit SecE [Firmicutes bacterium]|nr:preprotein translocase subunit SecE [Bacillota bacterium]